MFSISFSMCLYVSNFCSYQYGSDDFIGKAFKKVHKTFIKNSKLVDVPDPYYGGERGFDEVIDMIELGASGFLKRILTD